MYLLIINVVGPPQMNRNGLVVLMPVMVKAVICCHKSPVTSLMPAWQALGVLLKVLAADVLLSIF